MEAVGLISSSRQGRTSYWRLEEQRLEEARRQLNLISKQWDETLSRLKKHLEG
jgi:DNA-binding transcriptional regulator PaaX